MCANTKAHSASDGNKHDDNSGVYHCSLLATFGGDDSLRTTAVMMTSMWLYSMAMLMLHIAGLKTVTMMYCRNGAEEDADDDDVEQHQHADGCNTNTGHVHDDDDEAHSEDADA